MSDDRSCYIGKRVVIYGCIGIIDVISNGKIWIKWLGDVPANNESAQHTGYAEEMILSEADKIY